MVQQEIQRKEKRENQTKHETGNTNDYSSSDTHGSSWKSWKRLEANRLGEKIACEIPNVITFMFLSIAKRRTAVASARWLSSTPWFVEQDAATSPNPHISHTYRAPPLPEDAPKVLVDLHSQLIKSPHLEQSNLLVTRALSREMGPPPPLRAPHGRRRKGGTFAIETAFDIPGSLWSWTVFAEASASQAAALLVL